MLDINRINLIVHKKIPLTKQQAVLQYLSRATQPSPKLQLLAPTRHSSASDSTTTDQCAMTTSRGLQRSRCSTSGSDIHPLQSHVQDTSSLHDNTSILNAAESLMGHHRNATTPTSRNANCFKRESADSATNANLYMEVISSSSPTHPLHQKTMRIPSYGTCSFKKKNQVSRT